MSENQAEQPKVKLFREKSLEAIESPESLNDYLKVTSPGVWLVMAAVIALLVGAILWGVFGHIHSEVQAAVVVDEDGKWCYVPSAAVEGALKYGAVTVDGVNYDLDPEAGLSMMLIPGDASARLLKAGSLSAGDLVGKVAVDTDLGRGIYSGTVVTEDLKPMSLLVD